jgi:site-specific recombinase XerD
MSLKVISEILGHTKIATTEIYAKLERERIGEEFDIIKTKNPSENNQDLL